MGKTYVSQLLKEEQIKMESKSLANCCKLGS